MKALAGRGQVPAERIGVEAKRLVENRMWERYGKAEGRPRSEFVSNSSWWRTVAAELGFTDPKYGAASGSFYKDKEGDNGDIAAENAREIAAIDDLIDSLERGKEILRRHRARGLVAPDVLAAFRAESSALAGNMRDLLSSRHVVPTGLQPLFIAYLATTASADAVLTRLGMAVKQGLLETRRRQRDGRVLPLLSRKEAANICRGRVAKIPAILEPRSSWAAIWKRYHGAKCPTCGSRRTIPDSSSLSTPRLRCIHCYHLRGGETFPAPEAATCPSCRQLLLDDAAGRPDCPHCGFALKPPAAMGAGAD